MTADVWRQSHCHNVSVPTSPPPYEAGHSLTPRLARLKVFPSAQGSAGFGFGSSSKRIDALFLDVGLQALQKGCHAIQLPCAERFSFPGDDDEDGQQSTIGSHQRNRRAVAHGPGRGAPASWGKSSARTVGSVRTRGAANASGCKTVTTRALASEKISWTLAG